MLQKIGPTSIFSSQKRYKLLFEHAPVGMMTVNTEGKITEINQKMLELLAIPEKAFAKSIHIFSYPPFVEAGIEPDIEQVLESRKTRIAEYDYIPLLGKPVSVRCHMKALFDMDGQNVAGVHIVAEEIRYKKAITEQKNLLQEIIDNIPHGIYWKDKNFSYLGCNKAFAAKAGVRNPAEIIGKSDYDLAWKKEESDRFRKIDQKIIHSGDTMLDYEQQESWADGKIRTVLTSKMPLKNSHGRLIGLLGIDANISKLRSTEKKLIDLYKHLGTINRKISIILNVNKTKARQDKNEIVDFLLQSAINISEAKCVALYKFDNNVFHLISSHGHQVIHQQIRFMPEIHSPYLSPLVNEHLRFQKMFNKDDAECELPLLHPELQYLLGLPLAENEKLSGALFFGFNEKIHLTSQELDFYDVFAFEAAQALKPVLA